MAIPNNYIDKITDKDKNESRLICPAAENVRVENENFEADNLDDVLDEMQQAIDEAASQGGIQQETDPTVPSWAKQPNPPTPQQIGAVPSQGYVPLTQAEKDKLDALPTSSELGTQLGTKADKSTTYTKTETDNAIADAVEGLGGGSVESVTINGVNHEPINGVVDLGNIVGQQGPAGNTYLVDENFDPVSMIINNLDESDGTVALSARQGKILKQNVEALWSKVNALINDLAAMAFTGTKTPGLGTIDWTGGTFYATIVKSLTGCTATDNTTNGQIAEGTALTIQLTALSGYTLTGATISVTDSRGQSVAYTLNGSTLSVANVMGTITISVVAKAVYSVANNDAHVDMTTQTPNPVAGSSWSGTLSLKSSVTGYALASNPQVKMGGVAVDFSATGNSWNRSTGAMTIGNVTGDIVILEAAVEVVAHTVTKKLLNMTSSNTTGDTTDADFGYKMQSVEDGDSYSTTLTAVSGATSNNDVVVKMGGVDITSTAYDSSTGVVSIAEVTGDVTIIATAATGVIKVTSNAAVTGGITLSGTTISGTTITNKAIDLINGELTLEDAMQTITGFQISSDAKAAITSVDFGGAILMKNCFGGTSSSTACANLTSVLGAVLHPPKDGSNRYSLYYAYANCSSLAVLQTIGWTKQVDFMRNTFLNTALTALDVEDLNVMDTTLDSVFAVMANLSALRLPNLRNVEVFKSTFSNIGLESIKLDGGNITSLQTAFGNTRKLTFIDLSDTIITSSLTDVQQIFAAPSANKTLKIGSFDLSGVTSTWNSNMSCVKTLICTTITPPNSAMFGENLLTGLTAIYVPDAVVNDYRTAWSDKASIIHSINDYNA